MIKAVYFADFGIPKTGLTPVFSSLRKVSDLTSFVFPVISEVGGGWYTFNINPTELLVGYIDSGDSGMADSDRYLPFYTDVYDYLYEVCVVPVYDADSDALKILCFLTQNGKIRTDATSYSVSIYNSSHVLQYTLTTTSSTNGVAVLTKSSPGLVDDEVYYAVVDIILEGTTHTSIDTHISIE